MHGVDNKQKLATAVEFLSSFGYIQIIQGTKEHKRSWNIDQLKQANPLNP